MVASFAYKRYLMARRLRDLPPVPPLPAGLVWLPWDPAWLAAHAEATRRAFVGEIDARVFPNLADAEGCLHLMESIAERLGFCPGATWLCAGVDGPAGSVQGVAGPRREGAVQNLGVVPEWRGLGVGRALLWRALHGFRAAGLRIATLQVTARNAAVVRMYARWGFSVRQTVFRPPPRRP